MTEEATGQVTGQGERDLDERLAAVGGVVLDIDGCLILASQPAGHDGLVLPGAQAAVRDLRATGRGVVAFTNASSRLPGDIAASLAALGFDLTEHDVLTPAVVGAETLLARFGDAPVLAFGGPALDDVLRAAGVRLADASAPGDVEAVVVGWDTDFTQAKLQVAAEAIWRGAVLLTTSDAKAFASSGRPTASVGGFVAAGLSFITGVAYEVLGKPSPAAMAAASHHLGVPPSQVLVAGDDLTLETAMAKAAGGVGVLVTTGLHTQRDADLAQAHARPDLVVPGLADLVARLREADARAGTVGA